jgi:UDP-N-acetylmuramate dehydrogenase
MIDFLSEVPLCDKTSYKIGGPARWYAEPANADEVAEALDRARALDLPVFVLGKGSNILVSDRGWPGLAINLSASFTAIDWTGSGVIAQGGALLDTIIRESVCRGMGGMAELSGIPGTVGGAVVMNAGAFSAAIADTLVEAELFDMEDNRTATLDGEGLELGYRTSILRNRRAIVLSARFSFRPGTTADLKETRRSVLEKRKAKQPLDLPSCGSVFKRPPGNYAGTLIEQAGLKGERSGDAEISPRHANFIVNRGGAKAEDVRRLIALAQKRVFEETGILLEPEVVFAGEFEVDLFKL